MNDDPNATAAHRPQQAPGRFYWLKRLSLALGVFFALLIVLRIWWGYEAHRRLQTEIDRIIARGEPLFPEDFNPSEEIPDDQNAAILYKKAAGTLDLTPAQRDFFGWKRPPDEEWTDEHWRIVADLADASAEVRELIHRARAMPGVDWGLRVQSPAINMLLPDLGDQRQLAKVLRQVVKHQYRTGDHAAAIETIQDMLALGRSVDEMPTLISHLVAIAIDALALQALSEVLPNLQITIGTEQQVIDTFPAEQAELQELVALLLQDESLAMGLRRAMYGERLFQFDSAQIVAAGKLSYFPNFTGDASAATAAERILSYPISPLFEMEAVSMLKHMEGYIEASAEPTWTKADQFVGPLETKADQARRMPQRVVRPLSAILLPSMSRAVFLHYRHLDDRRQAAIGLAVRLYELDHGRRPEKLADLVPDYLPEVPIAPLLEDDQRYTYGDLSIDVLDSVSESGAADSIEARDDGEKIEDGQRQDGEGGDGGAEP